MSVELREEDIQGLKYFQAIRQLLVRLHDVGTQRDRAGNRELFFDQYAALLLLYFFNPILTSLRGLGQASGLKNVQRATGCRRTSLGSLSEASRVFDAECLKPIISELAAKAVPLKTGREVQALKNLTAVDGSLLPALPRMAWALWLDQSHRAAKMHLAFEVFSGVPRDLTVTDGNASERQQLRRMLTSDRLYVMDRGYAEYQLFQDILDAGSSFIGRLRDNAVWEVVEERPLSEEATAAGVRRDLVVRLGCEKSGQVLRQVLRVVEVETGKTDSRGQPEVLLLVSDRRDLPADLIALAYRYRWAVELFFRWFKCILGCTHLLSQSPNGVQLQVYAAIIASLLVSLWTGRKPTKRTFEMLCLYFAGWADIEELTRHLEGLQEHEA
jgi:hypothetical protein